MNYREFTCAVCGNIAIDRSLTKTKKYCSEKCAVLSYRMSKGFVPSELANPCAYNKEVRCAVKKCSTCGWNPKVEQKRKEAFAYG